MKKKIILSALLLYSLSIVNFSYLLIYQELRVIFFGIVSALLIIGLVNLEFKNQINIHNAFIYLGNASYSIYLTHGFFINNITKFIYSAKPDIIENIMEINFLGLIIISISLVFGCFIYKYLEKPLVVITKLIVAKIE
ncbi:acyltransferase family protein [Nostoc piscinale]|uniref:acyltransferase family protein n=1 Tax=Nostoc piscinale TaxID=224012 RepID=UPI001F20E786|nr:acyltransferase family protein [Nostoc piscinale]